MERVNLRRLPDGWGADEEALLQAVDDATATPIYIEYRLAPEWFDGIANTIDDLEECLPRRPDVAMALIGHMIVRLDGAGVDDSDGGLVELAHALDVEPFGSAAATHREALGDEGLRAIVAAAETRRTGDPGDAVLEHLIVDAQAALGRS